MKTCKDKLCTADEAVALIRDGATVATSGLVGAAHAEALTAAIERRFKTSGGPRDLTLLYAAGQGDGKTRGLNHLAHEGLIKRVIGGHWGLAPGLGRMAIEGKIEAYNFPQGVICHLFRDIAAGRPGCITRIGLDTFIDPRKLGGRLNERTPTGAVECVELGGQTWLWYKALPIDVGLIRATAADPLGNLIMDDEVMIGEVLPIAQAVRNSAREGKGLVIAQVKRLLDAPVRPQSVRVPGLFVDCVVVARDGEHDQTFAESFNEEYCRAASLNGVEACGTLPMDERRIIAARACDELLPDSIVNLGIGMPEGVAAIAAERRLLQDLTLTVESGPIGGVPASGLSFGASTRPHAIIDQPAMFDFYDGRGLDFAAIGAAQIDALGNVNVSKFGSRVAGVGGFVNITQSARNLVFCGTFTTGGLEVEVERGTLRIVTEGKIRKFIREVEQLSFAATRSRAIGQRVLYVTERAVFALTDAGLELIEVAPGIDVERDVLGQMEFRPAVGELKQMPPHVFE